MSVSTAGLAPVVIDLGPSLSRMSDAEFYALCRRNPDWRIERTAAGELYLMPPTGGERGRRNLALAIAIGVWAEADDTGVAFDSSTAFRLPGGGTRSPDASWLRRDRWDALTAVAREEFPPVCPDFVAEIRSPSDRLTDLRAKMEEYRASGARLGWLIDPIARTVDIYRPGQAVETLEAPQRLSGEAVLPGLSIELRRVWG